MNHEKSSVEEDGKVSSDRAFGWVLAVVFLLIAAAPLLHGGPWRIWSLALAISLAIAAALAPALLAPFNRLWTGLGEVLRRFMTPLILAFIFFVVLTPLGLLMRLIGKDLLRLRLDRNAASYWIERQPPGPQPESFKDQF